MELLSSGVGKLFDWQVTMFLKFDRGAGAEADEWSVLVTHFIGGKNASWVKLGHQLKMTINVTTKYVSFKAHGT